LSDFFMGVTGFIGDISCFCCGQELGIHFLHFPVNPLLNCFFKGFDALPFFFSPLLQLVCVTVLDRLVVGFNCLFSFL
jgi:hypothetical protein